MTGKTIGNVNIYTHHICFYRLNPRGDEALRRFCSTLMDYDMNYDPRSRRYHKVPKRVFAASPLDRSEYRIHINQLEEIKEFFHRIDINWEQFNVKEIPVIKGDKIDGFQITTRFEPFDFQKQIHDYFVSPGRIKVSNLQTGGGKSFIAMWAVHTLAVRTCLVVPARYIYKWTGDITGDLNVKEDRLVVVNGGKALRELLSASKEQLAEIDFIIISSTTLYNYIKSYEHNKWELEGYPYPPQYMYDALGIGLRIIDEVHENLHLNFKQDLYGHVDKTIALSATLEHDQAFINKILQIAYPASLRHDGGLVNKYINCFALYYKINKIEKLPYLRRKMYSQVKFEESILKSKSIALAYAAMVKEIVLEKFVSVKEPGNRMLIFADTKNMCTFLSGYLKEQLPDLDIRRYIGEDPDEDLYEPDVIVSTLKSSGTAVDIDGLLTVLMTSALGSKQQNLQAIGRLRVLRKYPNATPEFYYLVCENIDKHVEYHQRKVASFKQRVKSHKTIFTEFRL